MPDNGENKKGKKMTNKKKTKSVKKPLSTISAQDATETKAPSAMPVIDPDVQKVIQQAFVQFYESVSAENARKVDMNHFQNICREYLKCYITVGYDLNDNRVFMMHSENIKDRDAILEYFRFSFFNVMNNQVNGGGTDEMEDM